MSSRRELLFKEEGQEYGQVLKLLGDCRVEVKCFDNMTRTCRIRGIMRRKKTNKVKRNRKPQQESTVWIRSVGDRVQ